MASTRRPGESGDPPVQRLGATLRISSAPDYLPLVRANTRWFCDRADLPDAHASRVVLGIVEAVTNVIRHAYSGDPNGEIEISWNCAVSENEHESGSIEIEVLDRAPFVGPEARQGRDLDDVRPGGLGTHMMSCCVDEIEYAEREGGGTSLRLRKHAAAHDDPDRSPSDSREPRR